MPPDRDLVNLHDMVVAARAVMSFVDGVSHSAFLADAKTQSAVVHQVLILGEACKRISAGFREAHPVVPWALIARTRDILIHHYESIDLEEVWRIAVRDIPAILPRLEDIADQT